MFSFFRKSKTAIHKSKFNEEVHVGKSFGKKALYAKGIPQSGGEYGRMWVKSIRRLDKSPKSCLSLGVGAGTVIEVLRKKYPDIKIVGVEIDPVILDVARDAFGLEADEKTKLITADAIRWVEKNQKTKFDLIVVDLYIGNLNPPKSRTKKFLQQVSGMLKKDGMILYNCHYQKDDVTEYDFFLKRCRDMFSTVTEVFTYPKNRILLFR